MAYSTCDIDCSSSPLKRGQNFYLEFLDDSERLRHLDKYEIHNLYASSRIFRVIKSGRKRWEEHVARMGAMRNAFKILVVKSEGKRPVGRHKYRWEDNIETDLK
jgi:hypothetical protein